MSKDLPGGGGNDKVMEIMLKFSLRQTGRIFSEKLPDP